ncbi:ABC transporter permease [Bacillus toyonensis]|uniref:FtsX-like permease family protein n=1 Tax=Bacillus toyonensis TaxID=155322 RepID=UPI003D1969F2
MLFKLSIASMKKMMKDYIVLLIGLVISISIFYMFQTLALNTEFTKRNSMVSSIGQLFQVGSILLMFITFFYIIYANSFLLSLRRKELGMYLVLGAKKNKISQLLFFETLGMGVLALILGNGIGIILSKLVSLLLMKQLDISSEGYQAIYAPAWSKTCIFFGILFLFTSSINAICLQFKTEVDLIRTEQTTDRIQPKGLVTLILAVIGIGELIIGYHLIIVEGIKKISDINMPAFYIITGTYLIFISLLPLLVNLLKKTRLNEQRLNAFTFAQLRFRVNGLSKVLGTITILIGLGVGAMAVGISIQKNVTLVSGQSQIYDITLHDPVLKDYETMKKIKMVEKNQYQYKIDNQAIYYLKDDLLSHPPQFYEGNSQKNSPKSKRVSDKLPAPFYVLTDKSQANLSLVTFPNEWDRVFKTEFAVNFQMYGGKEIHIVDRANYDRISGDTHLFFVAKVDDFSQYKSELKEINDRQIKKFTLTDEQKAQKGLTIHTKYGTYEEVIAFSKGTVFMGFFLGIAFLAMMASCLMFKVLSGATKDIERYQMMRKIGVRKELLLKSIYKELGSVFAFPAVLGLIHVLLGINIFRFIPILVNPYANIEISIAIFLVIYAIYYLITVQLYKRTVLPKES